MNQAKKIVQSLENSATFTFGLPIFSCLTSVQAAALLVSFRSTTMVLSRDYLYPFSSTDAGYPTLDPSRLLRSLILSGVCIL